MTNEPIYEIDFDQKIRALVTRFKSGVDVRQELVDLRSPMSSSQSYGISTQQADTVK